MKKNWINILLFALISFNAAGQTGGYKFYCRLDSVRTAGFYNIEITPELSAHIKTDYSDIRIVNEAGKWIPHILHTPSTERTGMMFSLDAKFSIIENSGTRTTVIIEREQKVSSNIVFAITNTTAERFCTLSGSYDRKNWFVINDSILLKPAADENATENISRVDFPPTNYKFYKVVIHNNGKDPFNIKTVMEYTGLSKIRNTPDKLSENPAPIIQQKDSGKISYIKVTQQQSYQFDNISLQLSGVKYYSRKVDLYVPGTDKSSFTEPGQLLQSFTVSNNSTLQYNVPLTKSAVFYLLISNEDNLPLTVTGVKTACSNHYITAYLEAGTYRLIMDNEDAVMPAYDLVKLNNKIPDSISFLQVEKTEAFTENKPVVIEAKNNKWMLWLAIALALVILVFFTYRMLKEVDKRKNI